MLDWVQDNGDAVGQIVLVVLTVLGATKWAKYRSVALAAIRATHILAQKIEDAAAKNQTPEAIKRAVAIEEQKASFTAPKVAQIIKDVVTVVDQRRDNRKVSKPGRKILGTALKGIAGILLPTLLCVAVLGCATTTNPDGSTVTRVDPVALQMAVAEAHTMLGMWQEREAAAAAREDAQAEREAERWAAVWQALLERREAKANAQP